MYISPYRRGADDGLKFGLYLTAMFACSIYSGAVPLLGLAGLAMMLGVPLVTWRRLSSYDRDCHGCATFAMMWMQGVVMFAGAMLVAGAALAAYMTWVNPDFILQQWQAIAAMQGSTGSPDVDNVASIAQRMIDGGLLPTPMAIVIEFFLLAVTTGSVLSLICGALIAARSARRRSAEAERPRQP